MDFCEKSNGQRTTNNEQILAQQSTDILTSNCPLLVCIISSKHLKQIEQHFELWKQPARQTLPPMASESESEL